MVISNIKTKTYHPIATEIWIFYCLTNYLAVDYLQIIGKVQVLQLDRYKIYAIMAKKFLVCPLNNIYYILTTLNNVLNG